MTTCGPAHINPTTF